MNSEQVFKLILEKAQHGTVQMGNEMVTTQPTLAEASLADALEALARVIEVESNFVLAQHHITMHAPPPATGGGPVGVVN